MTATSNIAPKDVLIMGMSLIQWAIVCAEYTKDSANEKVDFSKFPHFVSARRWWLKFFTNYPNPNDIFLSKNWEPLDALIDLIAQNGKIYNNYGEIKGYIYQKIIEQRIRKVANKKSEEENKEVAPELSFTERMEILRLKKKQLEKKLEKVKEENIQKAIDENVLVVKKETIFESQIEFSNEPMKGIPEKEYEEFVRWKENAEKAKLAVKLSKENITRKLKI